MAVETTKGRLLLASASMAMCATGISVAHAQDAGEESADQGDTVVVTGSRLRRNEFDSISPLQVIDADQSRLAGLTTAAEFITQSPVVAGAQLDGSINSGSPTAAVEGVGAGGVGSNNISLRGLGPERTLLLVNGRRLAPSGVRGAPVAPDLNLIPGLMVETVEVLTDGASSIYGSDAVAGVANIILKKDFEGFEIAAQQTYPFEQGGDVSQIGFIAGANHDRGNVTVAAEYFNRNAVLVGDRPDFNDCLRDIEVGDDGGIRSVCLDGRPDNAAFVDGIGFAFNTPGETDIGTPGWTTSAGLRAQGINPPEQAIYNLQDEELSTQLLEELERFNIFASGTLDLDFWSRDTFYFEVSFAQRESVGRFTSEQIFPGVPAMIPQLDADGAFQTNPDGSTVMVDNPFNPFDVDALPVITVNALPQLRSAEVNNTRFVFGLEGDIPFMGDKNWVYDGHVSYDRSYGTASQPILRENAIRESLDTLALDANGDPVCGLSRSALSFGFLTPQTCVPVNFFAPSLFETQGGDKSFATQEETDFIMARAFNTTEIEQGVAQFFASGDVYDLPAGAIALGIGVEYRDIRIESLNDASRLNGTAASEVPDLERDTIGRTSLFEVFAETEIPLHETFDLNLAGRYTSEENFGEEFTYSIRAKFEPTDWLGLRGTFGTTFRAPNLREQFLAGSVGTIGGGNDPCIVPNEADVNNVYVPENDDRSPELLANCVADGVDPTALGLLAVTGIPTSTGGSDELQAETSESFTGGIILSNQWAESYDFDMAITYYSIDVEDTVRESDPASLLAQCYGGAPNLADPACSRISRNQGNPATATVSLVDASFINVGLFKTTGIDYNARFSTSLDAILPETDLGITVAATQVLTFEEQVDPESIVEDFVGTIAQPEWKLLANATLSKGPWIGLWRTSYIGSGQQLDSDSFVDPSPTGSACGILGYTGQCRDVDFVDSYTASDVSLSYAGDSWDLTVGVSNVFGAEPPLIDQGEGPSRSNIVVQSGYDLIGRRLFMNLRKRF